MKNKVRITLAILIVLLSLLLIAKWQQGSTKTLALEDIKNGTFVADKEVHRFENGYEVFKVGSPEFGTIDTVVFGDLDRDTVDDAAVVYYYSGGGTGVFFELWAIIGRDGKPILVSAAPLGDRVSIENVTLKSREISINMLTHGPNDPRCCPSVDTTFVYRLEGNTLTLQSSDTFASQSARRTGQSPRDLPYETESQSTIATQSKESNLLQEKEITIGLPFGLNREMTDLETIYYLTSLGWEYNSKKDAFYKSEDFGGLRIKGLQVKPTAVTIIFDPQTNASRQQDDLLTITSFIKEKYGAALFFDLAPVVARVADMKNQPILMTDTTMHLATNSPTVTIYSYYNADYGFFYTALIYTYRGRE
jgi:hypothetical protein